MISCFSFNAGAVGSVAEVHVLDRLRLDTGLRHRVLDGVSGHRHGRGHVEPATSRLGQTRPGVGHNNCFADVGFPSLKYPWSRVPHLACSATERCNTRSPSELSTSSGKGGSSAASVGRRGRQVNDPALEVVAGRVCRRGPADGGPTLSPRKMTRSASRGARFGRPSAHRRRLQRRHAKRRSDAERGRRYSGRHLESMGCPSGRAS